MLTNEIFDRCLAKVNPAIKAEVRENIERLLAEQRAIDKAEYLPDREAMRELIQEAKAEVIEKATEWLKAHLAEWSQLDDADLEDFKKAMEE